MASTEEDGHPTWSDADLDAFEAAYPQGGYERLICSAPA
jgi:hypothetical protein